MSAEPAVEEEKDPRSVKLRIAAIRWRLGTATDAEFVADCLGAGYSEAEAQAALAILTDPFEG